MTNLNLIIDIFTHFILTIDTSNYLNLAIIL